MPADAATLESAAAPPPCQVCGGMRHAHLITEKDWSFFRCADCGFVFMHPMLSPDEIGTLYSNPESGLTQAYFSKIGSKMRRSRSRMRMLAGQVKGGPAGRRFLDAGCSGGFTTEAARERGFDAYGIDIDGTAVAYAREHYPRNTFFVGNIEDWTPPEGLRFDAVYCSEVLEHVTDVNRFVAALSGLMAPGGVLYLTTPDIGHWRRPRDIRAWDVFSPPHHCVFFSEGNLRRLLEKHGLKVRRRRIAFKPGLKVFAEKVA